MGIFSFRRKKDKREDTENSFQQMTVEEALKKYTRMEEDSKADIMVLVSENCEQIVEVKHQLEEAKAEYEAVSAYLTDIQKIDAIPSEQRQVMEDAAEQIVKTELEQKKMKETTKTISDLQYHSMAQFEEDIERELPKLKEQEEYQRLVKEDMHQLEGEKGVQKYEIETALSKKNFLKKLSIASFILLLGIFILLIGLQQATSADLSLPFFLTGVLALLLIFYLVCEQRKSLVDLKKAEQCLNRAIFLSNKVKIKYVNCTASIDYAYEKYHVNGYHDLRYQFGEYLKAKRKIQQLEKGSEKVRYYQSILIKELKRFQIEDAETWCYQAIALLDKKEMVEVRHRLNVRRQKLRERIDYNTNQLDLAMNAMMKIRSKYPEYEEDIRKLMNSN